LATRDWLDPIRPRELNLTEALGLSSATHLIRQSELHPYEGRFLRGEPQEILGGSDAPSGGFEPLALGSLHGHVYLLAASS
jgi:hypothetical protein